MRGEAVNGLVREFYWLKEWEYNWILDSLTFVRATIIRTLVPTTTMAMITEKRAPIINAFRTARENKKAINTFLLSIPSIQWQPTVHVSHVNKFIGDDVVSVVRRTWSCHCQAVDIKTACYNGEDGNELKGHDHRWLVKESQQIDCQSDSPRRRLPPTLHHAGHRNTCCWWWGASGTKGSLWTSLTESGPTAYSTTWKFNVEVN